MDIDIREKATDKIDYIKFRVWFNAVIDVCEKHSINSHMERITYSIDIHAAYDAYRNGFQISPVLYNNADFIKWGLLDIASGHMIIPSNYFKFFMPLLQKRLNGQ